MTLCYLEPDAGKSWFVENGDLLIRIVEIILLNPSDRNVVLHRVSDGRSVYS